LRQNFWADKGGQKLAEGARSEGGLEEQVARMEGMVEQVIARLGGINPNF